MSMSMSKWLLAAAVSLASLSLTAGANASVLHFQYTETGQGAIDFSFDQSSTPVPNGFLLGSSTDVPVTNWTSNIGPASSILWFNLVNAFGGFDTDTSNNGGAGSSVFGPQVYTGLESAPVFAPGTFVGFSDQDNGLSGVLTVTTVTPLPPAWTMLIAGFVGLGFLAYRGAKKNTAVFAAA
jgi:hypothetical protein